MTLTMQICQHNTLLHGECLSEETNQYSEGVSRLSVTHRASGHETLVTQIRRQPKS